MEQFSIVVLAACACSQCGERWMRRNRTLVNNARFRICRATQAARLEPKQDSYGCSVAALQALPRQCILFGVDKRR